jgi:hypothetical protein
MDIFSIAAGAAGVGLLWFLKLAGSKALPIALAWVRAKWNARKPDMASLLGDIGEAHRKIDNVDALLRARFADAYAEIDEIKAKLGLPIGTQQAQPDQGQA